MVRKGKLPSRILKVLGQSPLPITTPDLTALVATGLSHPRQRVWDALRELEGRDLVVRERTARGRDSLNRGNVVVLWSLL